MAWGSEFDENEELAMALDNLQREVDGLILENQIFEEHISRKEAEGTGPDTPDARARSRRQKTKAPTRLTVIQKCEVANIALDQKQAEIEATKKSSEKLLDTLKAVLEETELRIGELKRDAYEFKRDIVVGAESPRTGKIMAEKVQKYMEDKLKSRDQTIDKLKLKNVTLKAQIQKVEGQLKQKEEMGDVLHYIDFHQLQIENKQYVSKIDEKNEELLKLKMTTGLTVQTLNQQKEKLANLIKEQDFLKSDIKLKTELLRKAREDHKTVRQDIINDKRTLKRMSTQQAETQDTPQILDYVNQKAEVYELQDAIKNWTRKVEIMEMAAKKARALSKTRTRQDLDATF